MPRYAVTFKADGGECRYVATAVDADMCRQSYDRNNEQNYELISIVEIPEEIERLHNIINHQCLLWDAIRDLERLYEDMEPDELEDVDGWLEDVCVGIDSPMDITDHETLFKLMNSLREHSGLDKRDYSEYIHEQG